MASGRIRLQVVPDASARSLIGFVRANVERGAIVVTDGWQGYAPLSETGYRHRPGNQREPRRAEKVLARVYRVFGKLKTWVPGTPHGAGHPPPPAYLDQFKFRFNPRRTPIALFQTLD